MTVRQAVAAGVSPAAVRRWVQRAAPRLRLPGGTITVAFVSSPTSRALNTRYRRKRRPTNVLSFQYQPALDGVIGELILCPAVIRQEAPRSGYRDRLRFLIEHGLIHLRGLDHQSAREQKQWAVIERQLAL